MKLGHSMQETSWGGPSVVEVTAKTNTSPVRLFGSLTSGRSISNEEKVPLVCWDRPRQRYDIVCNV